MIYKRLYLKSICMLSVVALISTSAGCGKKTADTSSDSSSLKTETSNATSSTFDWSHKGKTIEQIFAGDIMQPVEKITWPISEKPISIKVMKPLVMYDTEYGKLDIFKDYAKKTNINVEWNTPPAANFNEQFNLIMNSGTNMPDAIIAPVATDVERYGQQGIFIDLKDIINNNMPYLKEALKKYPVGSKVVTSDSGQMYSIPYISQFVGANNVLMARQDWLDALKLNPPQTIEDWYNVLKAFKEKDPNGNRKNDEIPFSGYGANGTGIKTARSLCTAWGLYDGIYVADKLQPKDKKVHYGPMESKYKEALIWINKLYNEGLIDKEIITSDSKAFQAKVLQNQVGAWRGQTSGDMTTLNDSAKKADPNTKFAVREMPIVKGPYGDQILPFLAPAAYNNGMVITKTNKYPKETAIWADYWYSEVGQTYVYGIEGVSYNKDSAGKVTITDWILKHPEGKTVNEARGAISFGRSIFPTVYQPWYITLQYFPDPVTEEGRLKYRKDEYLTVALPDGMTYTVEENNKIKQLSADINTYADETISNFITGKQPITDATWNAYVTKLKSMGIDELLKAYQGSYDRWLKK